MEADVAGVSEEGAMNKTGAINRQDVRDALTDWRKLVTIVFNVLATLPVSAFGYFMPLIVKGMGYQGVDASLMSVSPFVVGACGLFIFVYLSDKFKERSIVVASSMMLAVLGLIIMYTSDKPKLRYGFVHVCLAGAFTAGPLIVAWLAGNSPEKVIEQFNSLQAEIADRFRGEKIHCHRFERLLQPCWSYRRTAV